MSYRVGWNFICYAIIKVSQHLVTTFEGGFLSVNFIGIWQNEVILAQRCGFYDRWMMSVNKTDFGLFQNTENMIKDV